METTGRILFNGLASLEIRADGRIASLKLLNGRELLRRSIPLCAVELRDGSLQKADRFIFLEKDRVRAEWRKYGSAEMTIVPECGYFRIALQACRFRDIRMLHYCRIAAACTKYGGTMGGMYSDDSDMVCLRSLSLQGSVRLEPADRILSAYSEAELAGPAVACALAAAPRAEILPVLQELTQNEPVPKSSNGGAWSTTSELVRGSYVFADLRYEDTERWIDIARRGYFAFIHIHGWWQTLGHYEVSRDFFPGGLKDMKKAVEKIHQAGLKASFHTLSGCIEPDDSWVSPVPADDLIACARYTLAEDASPDDETIYITEKPIPEHERIWSYGCNGNAVKIGGEIIQYQDLSYTRPYCFRQCTRGAFGTSPQAHPKGEEAAYLQSRYLAFYPEPDGRTADQLADAIAGTYRALKLDGMYFDGSEGMRSRYGIDAMRWKIFQRLPPDAVIEASNWNHNDWWFHSRLGAWDRAIWAVKQTHDAHIRKVGQFPESNLLMPQLGWWAVNGPKSTVRGQFPDELEYFAMKCLAEDGPMSLQELKASGSQWNGRILEMLTVLGWYERFRMSRYFSEADRQRMREPGREFALRMNDRGEWKLRPVEYSRIRLPEFTSEIVWNQKNRLEKQPLRMRLEFLYALDCRGPEKCRLTDFRPGKRPAQVESAAQVEVRASHHLSREDGPRQVLRIQACNHGRRVNGAWAMAGYIHPFPHLSTRGGEGFAVWVKGDGSGALLDFRFINAAQYQRSYSDHFLRLDFTGWRYCKFLFRERDADRLQEYRWPFRADAGNLEITVNALKPDYIEHVQFYLNGLPSGRETRVEIGDLTSFAQARTDIADVILEHDRTAIPFPVTLRSGDYIELDGTGTGEHYSEQGYLQSRFIVPRTCFRRGVNRFRISARSSSGLPVRTEVTCRSEGDAFGTRADQIDWTHLGTEYERPRVIFSENGLDNLWTVSRRDEHGWSPNDSPELDFTLEVESAGNCPVENSLTVDGISTAEAYRISEVNHFEKYLRDAEPGSAAKSGIASQVLNVSSDTFPGQRILRMEAESLRGGDNIGWAAFGRHFAAPLDLSGKAALGLRLRSSLCSSDLQLMLIDSRGRRLEYEVPLCSEFWHYEELPLDGEKIDLSQVVCIIYSLKDIMCRSAVWAELEQVFAVDRYAVLRNPRLDFGGSSAEFPCVLKKGDVLHCSSGRFTVTDVWGKRLTEAEMRGQFPELKPGSNPVRLNFQESDCPHFRIRAQFIKFYQERKIRDASGNH